jgi:hypothetical protein
VGRGGRIGFKGFVGLCWVGRGFPSGLRGGTQDPVAEAFEGSNPSPRIVYRWLGIRGVIGWVAFGVGDYVVVIWCLGDDLLLVTG